jgi:multidrug efflux pump subunit AcrB
MSRFFISRPIFASGVISIVIMIAGLVASLSLPVAQYPEITPPTVIITATYPRRQRRNPGATVAAPIEEQLSGVEGLLYFNSESPPTARWHHRHLRGRHRPRQGADRRQQPQGGRAAPARRRAAQRRVVRKRSNNLLMIAALKSPTTAATRCSCRTTAVNVLDDLRRMPGVGDAIAFDAPTTRCACG